MTAQCSGQTRACLHGGRGPQIGEVTCGGSPHLSCKRDQVNMRDYVDRRVTHQSGLPHLPGVPHLDVNRLLMSHLKKKCTCFADCEFQKIDSCHEVFQTSLVDRQSGSTKIKHSISFPFIIPSKMQTCSFWSLCRTSHSFRKAVSLPLKWARLSDVDKVEIPHPTRPGNGQIPHSPGTSDGKCLGGRIDRRTAVTDCGCRLTSAIGS